MWNLVVEPEVDEILYRPVPHAVEIEYIDWGLPPISSPRIAAIEIAEL
jgi:hypothetical protein